MNSEQKLRRAELAQRADRAMSDHDSRIRDMLFAQIADTPAGRAYIYGAGPMPADAELIGELWATENGAILKSVLAENEQAANAHATSDRDARLAEIQKLPPQQRIAAARAEGFE